MHYCPQRRSEKISFELGHLFDSRTNNRALFIFRRYWRLKDQLSICLLVESLLLLSISIFPIISFIATVVAMIIIFISSRFYFTIIVFITSCISFFLFKRSNVSGVVTLLVDSQPLSVFCHMGNFGCGDGGWTPVMKIDGREVHTFIE